MSNIKATLNGVRAVAACFSTLAFTGSALADPAENNSRSLDAHSITSSKTRLTHQNNQEKGFNISEIQNTLERLNTLHSSFVDSPSTADVNLHSELSKTLFDKLKVAFPSATSSYDIYSEAALYQMLTQSLTRELNKIGLCFAISTKEGVADQTSLNSKHIGLYRIDSTINTALEVQNELPFRGSTVFVTPLTKRAAGNYNRTFLISDLESNSCIIDTGNHVISPTENDFLVQEPGFEHKAKKSDLVEKFGFNSEEPYREQAIRHSQFEELTKSFIAQKGYQATSKAKQAVSELYTQFRLLFKGELPGYTWGKILQRNSISTTSPNVAASRELFATVSESLKEDRKYTTGPVTGKLINIFKNEEAKTKLYEKILGKIYSKNPEFRDAIAARVERRKSSNYNIREYPIFETNTESKQSEAGTIAGVLLGAVAIVGLMRRTFRQKEDKKLNHIDQVPISRKPSSQEQIKPLSQSDRDINDCLARIAHLRELEGKIGMPGVLSIVAEDAISDENFELPEEVLTAAYEYMLTPNEDYKSIGICFLKAIFELQRSKLIPANIGGSDLVSFESMENISFRDWLNVGYPIYRLLKDKNLKFDQIKFKQLISWHESEEPSSKTLSFLDEALESDNENIVADVTNSWKRLFENIRLGRLGFSLPEQVSWSS